MNKQNNSTATLSKKLGYNPYRDTSGRFDDGPQLLETRGRPMVSKDDNRKKIDAAKKRLELEFKAEMPETNTREKVIETPDFIDVPGFDLSAISSEAERMIIMRDKQLFPKQTYGEYYAEEKQKAGDIFMLTPAEYRQALVEAGSYKGIDAIESRMEQDKIDRYTNDMLSGDKFPLPSLEYNDKGDLKQEGLHRVYAAERVGIETVPVVVSSDTRNQDIYPYKELESSIVSQRELFSQLDTDSEKEPLQGDKFLGSGFNAKGELEGSAIMTEAKAKSATKNSKLQGTFYHGTNQSSAQGIADSGFQTSTGENQWYGDGVYMTPNAVDAWVYGQATEMDENPATIVMSYVDVQDVFDDVNEYSDMIQTRMLEEGFISSKGQNLKEFKQFEASNRITKEVVQELLNSHDAVIIPADDTHDKYLLVKDPANIKTFRIADGYMVKEEYFDGLHGNEEEILPEKENNDSEAPTVTLTIAGGKKAEFPAKYYRMGELPGTEGSRNWNTGELEGGVSVMKGYEDPDTGKIILDGLQNEHLELLAEGQKLYEVEGSFSGLYGSDGEDLLDVEGIKYTKEVDPSRVVTDNNPDYNLLGDDVSEEYETFPVPPKKTPAKNSIVKSLNQISARDFANIYKDMDIDVDNLGCIMLDLEPIKVMDYMKDSEDDLFENPKFDQGSLPAESVPHVTLLYGLLENGNIWKKKVDALLKEWSLKTVTIESVGFFDTPDSYAVIAHLRKTPELVDGHERLTLLPHVNTFSEYLPHMTLAYISKEANPKKWVKALGKQYNGKTIKALGINYGDKPEKKEGTKSSLSHVGQDHNSLSQTGLIVAENALDSATRDIIAAQGNSLRDGFASIERDIVEACVTKVQKNYLEQPSDVITQAQRKQFENDVATLLTTFYINLYPLFGRQLLSQRASEYGYVTSYEMTADSQAYIEEMAQMAAVSHVNTVIQDVLVAASLAYTALVVAQMLILIKASLAAGNIKLKEQLPNNPTDKQILVEINKGTFDNTDMYKEAQKLAREGAGQAEIVKAIRDKYTDISKNRATTIARTESARVFNQSQYEADKQFLVNSGLMDKAYKKLRSRTGTPCIHCKALINKPPIPFTQNFADLNTTLTATETSESGEVKVKHLPINWEPVTAGNVHPNCNCEYVLIIK